MNDLLCSDRESGYDGFGLQTPRGSMVGRDSKRCSLTRGNRICRESVWGERKGCRE